MSQTTNLLGSRFRIRNDRQAKALTGCSVVELEELLPVFEQFLVLRYQTLKSTRQRDLGGGKKGALPLPADKLIHSPKHRSSTTRLSGPSVYQWSMPLVA